MELNEKLLKVLDDPNTYFIQRTGLKVKLTMVEPDKRTGIILDLNCLSNKIADAIELRLKKGVTTPLSPHD